MWTASMMLLEKFDITFILIMYVRFNFLFSNKDWIFLFLLGSVFIFQLGLVFHFKLGLIFLFFVNLWGASYIKAYSLYYFSIQFVLSIKFKSFRIIYMFAYLRQLETFSSLFVIFSFFEFSFQSSILSFYGYYMLLE